MKPAYDIHSYVFEVLAVLTVAYVPSKRCRVVSLRRAKRKEREAYHDWLENHDSHE